MRRSIPGAGLSLFAGKHYNTNDTVLTSNLAFKLGEESRNLLEFGLILKHHPLLANLNGGIWRHDGDGMSELTASKEILPGHELFLSFNDHPGSTSQSKLFSNIPQPEHYELADEIVKEEMKNQRRGTPRRGNQPNGECCKFLSADESSPPWMFRFSLPFSKCISWGAEDGAKCCS